MSFLKRAYLDPPQIFAGRLQVFAKKIVKTGTATSYVRTFQTALVETLDAYDLIIFRRWTRTWRVHTQSRFKGGLMFQPCFTYDHVVPVKIGAVNASVSLSYF
jgi:hypothetical protein